MCKENNKKIVILQPQFLDWAGAFEQIMLADIYVHYDDVQYEKNSRINRIQIKTSDGIKWITAPIKKQRLKTLINETIFDDLKFWRKKHLKSFEFSYSKAPFYKESKTLLDDIYSFETNNLCEFNINAIEKISKYLGFNTEFMRSSSFGNGDLKSSLRLIDIIKKLNGNIYISGLGAKNYINYDLFEKNNIRLEFMDYACTPYPQLYGEFTPYVTIFDLIANCGKTSIKYLNSKTKYWKESYE